jgi:hypothetical protein
MKGDSSPADGFLGEKSDSKNSVWLFDLIIDRVARWFVFKPKIPICVEFEGTLKIFTYIFCGHLEYYMDILDVYDHLVHFVFIWYILCSFGTFFRF